MTEAEFFSSLEPARLSHWATVFMDTVRMVAMNEHFVMVLFALTVALGLSHVPFAIEGLAQRLRTWGRALRSYGEKRKMRRERENAQRDHIITTLINHIEDAVDEGSMTRTEANSWYALIASARRGNKRIFDQLRWSIEKPLSLKSAIAERRLNEARDANGNIIPVPLPKEDAKPQKINSLLGLLRKPA